MFTDTSSSLHGVTSRNNIPHKHRRQAFEWYRTAQVPILWIKNKIKTTIQKAKRYRDWWGGRREFNWKSAGEHRRKRKKRKDTHMWFVTVSRIPEPKPYKSMSWGLPFRCACLKGRTRYLYIPATSSLPAQNYRTELIFLTQATKSGLLNPRFCLCKRLFFVYIHTHTYMWQPG
jgi:hypothetical protein